jgi:hypothetical protein
MNTKGIAMVDTALLVCVMFRGNRMKETKLQSRQWNIERLPASGGASFSRRWKLNKP